MTRFFTVLLFVLLIGGWIAGQTHNDLLGKLRDIKLLESTRDDVRRILADYNTDETDEHVQRYYNDQVDIKVSFADGTCKDDPHEEEFTSLWRVEEWRVTRIEVEWEDEVRDIGFDLSKLVKEQTYRGEPSHHTYHDKSLGVAIGTNEDGISTLIFYPPAGASKNLCEKSVMAKAFYGRKSWFTKELEKRFVCELVNQHANVEDMSLSATEVEATTGKTISVTTVAKDPENDVLTYNYTVTGGTIIGTGAKVVWDLSRVPPGTYSILVGVDDGMGIVGKTVTKTVTVK